MLWVARCWDRLLIISGDALLVLRALEVQVGGLVLNHVLALVVLVLRVTRVLVNLVVH